MYHRLLVGCMTGLALLMSCTPSAMTPTSATGSAHVEALGRDASPLRIPGIPNRPEMVTVVPFAPMKGAGPECQGALGRVPIEATVDGRSALFLLDMGSPHVELDPASFPANPTLKADPLGQREQVQLRIGTLLDAFDDSALADPAVWPQPAGQVNAQRERGFDKENCWVGGPIDGLIGIAALEPFETIIDYAHRRLILIRLDATGHRLVAVPAYTPQWSAPLMDVYLQPGRQYESHYWGVHGQLAGVDVAWIFDTGSPFTLINTDAVPVPLPNTSLTTDALVIGGRPFHATMRRIKNPTPYLQIQFMLNILGAPFLQPLGVVGFNHRTRQFILYR